MRGDSDPKTHCPHKDKYSFCTSGAISAILTALKSWDSADSNGIRQADIFQVSNVENWARMWKKRFWSLFPDPLFSVSGLQSQVQIDFRLRYFLFLQILEYFPGIPLLRSRIPHLLQKPYPKRCATPPSHTSLDIRLHISSRLIKAFRGWLKMHWLNF